MEFESLDEAWEVAEEFKGRARELRTEAQAAEPSRGSMLETLARTYERHAIGLELYVAAARHHNGEPMRIRRR